MKLQKFEETYIFKDRSFMAKEFYIKNRKKLFGMQKVLSVAEALIIPSEKSEKTYNQYTYSGNEIKEFLRQSMENMYLTVGVEGESLRGF